MKECKCIFCDSNCDNPNGGKAYGIMVMTALEPIATCPSCGVKFWLILERWAMSNRQLSETIGEQHGKEEK